MEVHISIAAETLFHLGPIPVTNAMLTMFLVMGFLLITGRWIAKHAQDVPNRSQSIFEVIAEFLLGLVESTGGKKAGRRIFPLIGGMFIFILFANYSGLLPGVGTIGYYEEESAEHSTTAPETTTEEETHEESLRPRVFEVAAAGSASYAMTALPAEEEEHGKVFVPFFRSPNADLNMTLAMALLTFTLVQVAGIRAHGVVGRIKHMANPPFLFPIEVVSELSRIISLSARLFGNVFAGEALLAVMYAIAAAIKVAIIPLFIPVVFLFLEVLFGAVQALVFALLTLIYITLATDGGHEEHAEHEEASHGQAPAHAAAGAGD